MELILTNIEAEYLISLVKNIVKKHVTTISYPSKGDILIKSFSEDQRVFRLTYYITETRTTYQFLDETSKHTLFRVNLNRGFHKNANGERIFGNRINVFSEEEFLDKNDGQTHTKAYPLPYLNIRNSDNILDVLKDVISYSNIQNEEMLQLNLQEGLDV